MTDPTVKILPARWPSASNARFFNAARTQYRAQFNGSVAPVGSFGATVTEFGSRGNGGLGRFGPASQYDSVATTGSIAGAKLVLPDGADNVRWATMPLFRTRFRTGASIAACRLWAGLFNADPTGSDSPATTSIGLRFSTAVPDATVKLFTRVNGVTKVKDLGVALVASKLYGVEAWLEEAGTKAYCRFYGEDVADVVVSDDVSDDSTGFAEAYTTITTLADVSKIIRVGSIDVET